MSHVAIQADAWNVRAQIEVDDSIEYKDQARTQAQHKALLLEAIRRTFAALYPDAPKWEPRA